MVPSPNSTFTRVIGPSPQASGMDYLLTWNCKHIANAAYQPRVGWICRGLGYEPPVICTPEALLEG